jgi:hypothetical protein
METWIESAMLGPLTASGGRLTLSGFLSQSVSTGSCFCCGLPTDLLLDGDQLVVRCSSCGAEILVETTVGSETTRPVLQAA